MKRDEFERVVEEALDKLPEEIAAHLENVIVIVEDRPTEEQLDENEIEDPLGLYGLYEGTPFTERSLLQDSGMLPDRITIFQEPLEADFHTRRGLVREIQKTVAHEVAHVFGIGEERLEELGLS